MMVLFSIVIFVLVLLVLVLAHEWGHFIVARRCGVRVYEFGFGFPPRIVRLWQRAGTEYTLNWIPLGGFVRLKGENGEHSEDTDSFSHQCAWKRLAILFAGVAMNVVVGYALYVAVFAMGADAPRELAQHGAIISDERVMIGRVLRDSPAVAAGLQSGDVLVAVNNVPGYSAQLRQEIRDQAGKPVSLTVLRGEQHITVHATPRDLGGGAVGVGIHLIDVARIRYPLLPALRVAARETVEVSQFIFRSLKQIVRTLAVEGRVEEGVSGPVGIAAVTGQVARAGVVPLLQLMALLSINLAVLNVLPIPALDGGRVLFVVLEKILRRRTALHMERLAHLVGFALLMTLVLFVTYRDIVAIMR